MRTSHLANESIEEQTSIYHSAIDSNCIIPIGTYFLNDTMDLYFVDNFLNEPYSDIIADTGSSETDIKHWNRNFSAFYSDQIRIHGNPDQQSPSLYIPPKPASAAFAPVYKKVLYNSPNGPNHTYYYSQSAPAFPRSEQYQYTYPIYRSAPAVPVRYVYDCSMTSPDIYSVPAAVRGPNVVSRTAVARSPYTSAYHANSSENVVLSTPTCQQVRRIDSSCAVHANVHGVHSMERQTEATCTSHGCHQQGIVSNCYPAPQVTRTYQRTVPCEANVIQATSLTHQNCASGGSTSVSSHSTCVAYPGRDPLSDEIGLLCNRRDRLLGDIERYNRDRELIVVAADRRNRLESVGDVVRHYETHSPRYSVSTYHTSLKPFARPLMTKAVTFTHY